MADKWLRIIGGYELIVKIGQGGMGAVFKARQVSLDRIVALKVLPPSIAKDVKFIERFQREARASAKLNHPNIVQGIDVGQDAATGLWYFAMELVDGPSLQKVLEKEKLLPEARALDLTRQVARALECAESHGIVHRDIKPDNIILNSSNEAKLADLGLAKKLNEDAGMTQSGEAVGTPNYIAPEQARGEKDIDIRADIYALGATLFHLVTGNPPFSASTGAAVMVKHLTEKAPLAHRVTPGVSEACGRLIERMLQKEKEKRIQTPTELIEQIDKILKQNAAPKSTQNNRVAGARVPAGTRVQPKPKPRQSPIVPFAAALITVAAIGLFVLWLVRRSDPHSAGAAVKNVPATLTAPKIDNTQAIKAIPVPVEAPKEKPVLKPAATPITAVGVKPVVPTPKDAKPAHGEQNSPPADVTTQPLESESKTKVLAISESNPAPAKTESKAAAAAVAQVDIPKGPSPSELAHERFVTELVRRTGKELKDLPKVQTEMRELSLKAEFAPAKDPIALEMTDLERAIHFEEKAMELMAAAKGEIEVPEEMAKLANGAKMGRIVNNDRGRGIYLSVGGAEVSVPCAKLPPRKIVEAAGIANGAAASADYYFLRGMLEEARKLTPRLSEQERVRFEQKQNVLKAGQTEQEAEAAYQEILGLVQARQWKDFRVKLLLFNTMYGQCAVVGRTAAELARYNELAELALQPPVLKLFHASAAKMLPDGFLQLEYDFSTPEQAGDFACDHGELSINAGWLTVPPGGDEFAQARFKAPIAELRTFSIGGKVLKLASRFGIYVYPPGEKDGDKIPKCILRPYNHKAHLENWQPPFILGNDNLNAGTNSMGAKEIDWIEETRFAVEVSDAGWEWKVAGHEIGRVKLPVAAIGGNIAFVGVDGSHAWHDFKVIFKPDAAWVKQQLAPVTK